MRSRGHAVGLSHEEICDAALDLTDTAGLDGVTVRSVAARLGVHPSALYNHVRDKEALLDAMAARCLDRLPAVDPDRPVTDELRAVFRAWRALGIRHPGLLRNLGVGWGGQWLLVETVQAALLRAGLSPEEISSTFVALMTITVGSAVLAADVERLGGEGELRRQLAEQIGHLPDDEFPALRERALGLATSATLEEHFEHQLDLVLAPLAAERRD